MNRLSTPFSSNPTGNRKMTFHLGTTRMMLAVAVAPLIGPRTLTTVSVSLSSRLVPCPLDLVNWVRREGGFVHQGLRVGGGDSPGGFNLVASEEIPNGSDLIRLPKHLPLAFEPLESAHDESHALLVQLASKIPEELWAMELGMRLLQERATVGSFWWPYICNLPESFSSPIFFSGEDIKNLQYAPFVHQVNKRCRFLLDFDKEVNLILENVASNNHPFRGQHVDASSLGWAMSAVSTRAFRLHGKTIPNGTKENTPMLLPLIDMCNHSFLPNSKIIQEEDIKSSDFVVKVVAQEQIQPGSSVVLNYGNMGNDLLLLDYGFVDPENPYETVELKYDALLLDAASMAAGVQSARFSTPTQWQRDFLQQLNLEGTGADLKVSLGGTDVVDGRLLAGIRISLANDRKDIEQHSLSSLHSLSTHAPLGISNEIATLRTLIAICVIALGSFPTKIMEDESLLKGTISGSMKLAIEFRMRKKTLLTDVMGDLTRRVNLLSKEKVPT